MMTAGNFVTGCPPVDAFLIFTLVVGTKLGIVNVVPVSVITTADVSLLMMPGSVAGGCPPVDVMVTTENGLKFFPSNDPGITPNRITCQCCCRYLVVHLESDMDFLGSRALSYQVWK